MTIRTRHHDSTRKPPRTRDRSGSPGEERPGRSSRPKHSAEEFTEGQEVDLVIGDRTEIGYIALIDTVREGMLYRNEVFQTLKRGQQIRGFIKKVREDGKIDVSLQKPGPEKVDEAAQKLLEKLRSEGGFVAVTDATRPEAIYGLFGVSKKTFKKALGGLYKKRLILLESGGIRLASEEG